MAARRSTGRLLLFASWLASLVSSQWSGVGESRASGAYTGVGYWEVGCVRIGCISPSYRGI